MEGQMKINVFMSSVQKELADERRIDIQQY